MNKLEEIEHRWYGANIDPELNKDLRFLLDRIRVLDKALDDAHDRIRLLEEVVRATDNLRSESTIELLRYCPVCPCPNCSAKKKQEGE